MKSLIVISDLAFKLLRAFHNKRGMKRVKFNLMGLLRRLLYTHSWFSHGDMQPLISCFVMRRPAVTTPAESHGCGLQGHLIGVYMTEVRCELTFLPGQIVIVVYMFGFTVGQTKTVPPRAK